LVKWLITKGRPINDEVLDEVVVDEDEVIEVIEVEKEEVAVEEEVAQDPKEEVERKMISAVGFPSLNWVDS